MTGNKAEIPSVKNYNIKEEKLLINMDE